ncbi:MAG: YfhO family protein [Bacteroidetes bacterium]|nr:YfhO family protein [Bacteroidota bacterium]
MNEKLKLVIPHAAAIIIFIVFSSVYFSPLFNGYNLKQNDIKQFQGMSKDIADFRIQNEKEPLWTNSMFSGMPAYQISVIHHNNYLIKVDRLLQLNFALPRPVGLMFLAMLGFYIFALCLRVNPWLGIVGAIAFGFSTINILYIGAGHMTKVNAIAYMAPALGGLILAFRGKWLLGSVIFALFFGLNLTANHLQMTYYLVFLLFAVAVAEGIRLLIDKNYLDLGKAIGGLAIGGVLSLLPSFSNLQTTLEYSKYTTRGATDLTIEPKGQTKKQSKKEGLDVDYILEYNYGKGEILSLIAPNAKGAKDDYLGNDEDIMLNVDPNYSQLIGQMNRYWGGQRMSGGAIYFGVVMFVFFLFGLVFLKDSLRWPFLAVSLLCMFLAAKDPGGINDFFIHKFPLYNKFRDSKMILVLLQVMIPALGILFLDRLFKKEHVWGDKKSYLIAGGAITCIGLILFAFPSISGSFLRADEIQQFNQETKGVTDVQNLSFINGLKTELIKVRTDIYKAELGRTLFLALLGIGLILISVYTKISKYFIIAFAFICIAADNIGVSKRYLNNEETEGVYTSYEEENASILPTLPQQADLSILQEEQKNVSNFTSRVQDFKSKMMNSSQFQSLSDDGLLNQLAAFSVLNLNSNYRVLNFSGPFNETNTSYFHKSIGGYHGAKLKRYQELIDFYLADEINVINKEISAVKNVKLRDYASTMNISKEQAQGIFDSIQINELSVQNAKVMNMLNVKYIHVDKTKKAVKNTNTNGNAWFAQKIVRVKSANEEMLELGKNNLKSTAIVHQEFKHVSSSNELDSNAKIQLTKYDLRELTYKSTNSVSAPAIFSEIYYPEGWNCYVDGKKVENFRANYVLRGAMIPAGSHVISWKFEPKSFETSSTWSLIGSILTLLTFIGICSLEVKNLSFDQFGKD